MPAARRRPEMAAARRRLSAYAYPRLVEFVDEDRSLALQVSYYVRVVHDLPTHVDRSRIAPQRQFDDVDRPLDAGTERTGRGQQYRARTS